MNNATRLETQIRDNMNFINSIPQSDWIQLLKQIWIESIFLPSDDIINKINNVKDIDIKYTELGMVELKMHTKYSDDEYYNGYQIELNSSYISISKQNRSGKYEEETRLPISVLRLIKNL